MHQLDLDISEVDGIDDTWSLPGSVLLLACAETHLDEIICNSDY